MFWSPATMPRLKSGGGRRLRRGGRTAGPICYNRIEFFHQKLQKKIESEQFRKDNAQFGVGDSVKVHTKVIEGDKERIQIFSGVVIGKRGTGLNETFSVRRISYGEGVERVFPLHSPRVDKIEVERHGQVRRAKLTYLRKRLGQGATLVNEKQEKAVATPAK